MKPDFDAIAVGGGLAGSTYALALAAAGSRVAIIERTPKAQLKVCGDFLSTEAQALLLKLGIDVHALDAKPITKFRMVTGNRAAMAPLPFEAVGLSRLLLDETLLNRAGENNVEIIRGHGVTSLDLTGPLPAIHVADKCYTAKNIALATGKHNLRGWQRTVGKLSAYKMTFELTTSARNALSDIVQLVGYTGGYIGACNIENGASTLCWLVDAKLMKRCGSNWQKQLSEIAGSSPYIEDLLDGAKALFDKPATTAGIPFGYKRRKSIHQNVYALGDQIAVIPSFTGDGTSIAISSGLAAAEATLKGEPADHYHRNFLSRLSKQFLWATAIELTFKSAITRRLSVAAISAFPALATTMTELTRLPADAENRLSYRSTTMK